MRVGWRRDSRRPGRRLLRPALAAGGAVLTVKALGILDDRAVLKDPRGGELVPLPPATRQAVVSADATVINVQVYGPDGAPTVVLAHGWTCSVDFWTAQIRALAGDLRVVAYDQRGHGRSGRPGPAGYTMAALADDLLAVLDAAVPAGEKVVLAGHSMGGFTALAFAGRHHDDLLAGFRILPVPARLRGLRTALTRAFLSSTAPTGPASPISRRVIRFLSLSPGASPAQVAFCEQIVLACPPAVRGGFGAQFAQVDLTAEVPRLDVPTLVMVGRADRLLPPDHSRRLAAALPALVELRELPGVGHMTPVEAPAVVSDLIRLLTGRYLTPAAGPPAARAAGSAGSPDGSAVAARARP